VAVKGEARRPLGERNTEPHTNIVLETSGLWAHPSHTPKAEPRTHPSLETSLYSPTTSTLGCKAIQAPTLSLDIGHHRPKLSMFSCITIRVKGHIDSSLVSAWTPSPDTHTHVHTQNGLAKSFIKCLQLVARPLLMKSKLPMSAWGHAILHAAALIRNRPTS